MLFLNGFFLGASLIIAIGSQNAFVLQQGILRKNIFLVCLICFLSDFLLMTLGGIGIGSLFTKNSLWLKILTCLGAIYLFGYGTLKLKAFFQGKESIKSISSKPSSKSSTIIHTLSITFLNPHVYLDTVVLIGSVAAPYPFKEKITFLLGCFTASLFWFFGLGYGASRVSPLLQKPTAWKIINLVIAVIMYYIAFTLILK